MHMKLYYNVQFVIKFGLDIDGGFKENLGR